MKKRKKQVVSVLLSVCMFLAMLPAAALAAEGEITYQYWDENAKTIQTGTIASDTYRNVQSSDVDWGADGQETWYIVSGEISINNSVSGSALTDMLFVRGTVHLILTDGSVLNCGRIVTKAGSTLHIHAQSNADERGKVATSGGIGAYDNSDTDAEIVIHGGKIEAAARAIPVIGSDHGGYTVKIYGGAVTAVNEYYGAGIWADDVILQGCSVNVHSTGHNGIYGANSITLSKGDITVQSGTANGIYSLGNITVNGGNVNVDAGDGKDNTCGILAGGVFEAREQARITVNNNGKAAAIEGGQGVVINGSEVKSISANSNGIWSGTDIKITDGANVTAEGAFPALWAKNGVEIDGSRITLSGQSDGIWTPEGGISIRNSSEVTVNVNGGALAAGGGNITVSGSTVDLSSKNANGMNAVTGAVEIKDGSNVTASGKNPALFGQTQVTVSGSTINAVSTQDVGIYSPGTAILTDSVVTARGGDGSYGILTGTQNGSAVSGSWVDGTYRENTFGTVANTMTIGNGMAEVTGNAAVPQGVTLPQGTEFTIPEGGSLKINDNVTITSLPAGQQATVGENGKIDLPTGAVVSVAGEQVTVPAEGGSVNFGGDVDIYTISLDQVSLTIPFGETAVLTATVKPEGAEIIWNSADENIASVVSDDITSKREGNATITAKGEGKTTITARAGNTSATCQVTVDHNWLDEWSHNNTHHWHNCAAAESCAITKDEEKEGYEKHSPGEWIVDKEPTAEEDGSRHKECTECGFIMETEIIPAAPKPSANPNPSETPSASPAPSEDPSASPAPSEDPSASPAPSEDPSASPAPSEDPSVSPAPSEDPSVSPAPSEDPSVSPAPSEDPSVSPAPSEDPSASPAPSEDPSASPAPSEDPSVSPAPSEDPSVSPAPSEDPSASPAPSEDPSVSPAPSEDPSVSPAPSEDPSVSPAPSEDPSVSPAPSEDPSTSPAPSEDPSVSPVPSEEPTASPAPPVAPTSKPTPEPVHTHSWSKDWKGNSKYHWHDCVAEGCNVTENSEKEGYGEHLPGDWLTDIEPTSEAAGSRHRQCVVCGFVTETAEIPAAGSQGGGAPFIRNDAEEKGWAAVKAAVEKAAENSIVDIVMNGAVLVPGEILNVVKGRDITLVFDMGDGVVWSVNGKLMTAAQAGDIDFSVKKDSRGIPDDLARNMAAGNTYRQFSLTHNGDFGFTATLFLDLGKENHGCPAILYYYNKETGRLETAGQTRIAENGIAGFAFTHASDYMVVIEKKADTDSSDESGQENNPSDTNSETALTSPATGDIQFIWLAVYGLAAILAGFGIFIAGKRHHRP